MRRKIMAVALSFFSVLALTAPCAGAAGAQPCDETPRRLRAPLLEAVFMYKGITNGNLFNDSLLVLRGGELVYERYACGWGRDTPHAMYSVTKSVLSALVGVAVGEGKIESVHQRVIDFYPDAVIPPGQESKRDITIEHLLTQTSGLPGDSDREADGYPWWDAADSGRAAFEIPQMAAPGERFAYSSGPGMQALACLVSRAAGRNLFDYAREKLFEPLGMASVLWDAAADGNNYGGFGIYMTPMDMLRLGYLYLRNGEWDGAQVIPAEYVAATPPPSIAGEDYGYLFWGTTFARGDSYQASGSFGQFICVLPEWDAVIVRTGSAGPATRFVNGSKDWNNQAVNNIFVQLVLPLLPLKGIPLDYFRATL
jgi:CubicO group peptidase (beta-lactamase class C family)